MGLPQQLEGLCQRENSFPNPKFETLKRLGRWTGDEPEFLRLYEIQRKGTLLLPRGYFPVLISNIRKSGNSFAIDDQTICPPLPEKITVSRELFGYQERGLNE